MTTRRHFLGTAAASLAMPALANAEPAPLRLATVVVGFPPGGGTDVVARLLAGALRGTYAENVVVENRSGAGGRLAAQYLKDHPADGSVLLFTPAFPLVIYPHIYRNLRYDSLSDFAPMALTHYTMAALSVGPAVPAGVRTVADFIAWLKAHPEGANFGAPAGSPQHFIGEMFARAMRIKLNLISYPGGAPSVKDCLGGHTSAVITAIQEVLMHQGEGKLRILATTGPERSPTTPQVPTMAEVGAAEATIQDWSGFLVPARTPAAVIARGHAAINAALGTERVIGSMGKLGLLPAPTTSVQFAKDIKASWEKYREVVKATGFVAEG